MKSKRHFITIWAMCSFFLWVFIMPPGYSQAAEARSDEEYEQEIGRLEQALKECRDEACKKETLLKKADTHFAYGKLLKEKRQFEAALAQFQKAQEIDRIHRPEDAAFGLRQMADIYTELHRFPDAIKVYKESLGILEKLKGKEDSSVATVLNQLGVLSVLNQLGVLYYNMGDYVQAKPQFEQALAIVKKSLGNDHQYVAATSNNLAGVYDSLGEYGKAKGMYEQALIISETSGEPELLSIVQGNLSYLLAKTNKPGAAIFLGKQAVNTIQTMRSKITGMEKGLQKSFLKTNESYYKHLADLLIDQGRLPEAQQVLAMLKEEEYFDFIRRDATRSGVRSTTATYNEAESPWAERYAEISGKLVAYGREYTALAEKEGKGALTEQETARLEQLDNDLIVAQTRFSKYLSELIEYFDKLSVPGKDPEEIAVRQREIGAKNLPKLMALQETLRELGSGVVLMHYLVTQGKLRIILTTPDIQLARDAVISDKDLNHKIHDFRQELQNRHGDPLPYSKELYKYVLGPVADDLRQAGAKILMLSLDGTLRYLPIAALHDGNAYIAENYKVVIFTEAAKDKIRDKPVPEWQVAGLGLSRAFPEQKLGALPAVPEELEGIVRKDENDRDGVLPGIVRMDQDFDYKAVRRILRRKYPVLHIASHFVFKPANEITSYLVLGDGSPLTLLQMKNELRFNGTDMMTLSACNTAMAGTTGREIEGFGVLAQNQGAKAVLATLWPVMDKSTGIFMQNLYRLRHEKNLTKAAALQQAQIMFIRGEIRDSESDGDRKRNRVVKMPGMSRKPDVKASAPDVKASAPYTHPYYWAPFILMGNWL